MATVIDKAGYFLGWCHWGGYNLDSHDTVGLFFGCSSICINRINIMGLNSMVGMGQNEVGHMVV